jgi:phosphopantetheine adenylyltransferase
LLRQLKQLNFKDFEIAQFSNLFPQSVEEARVLIPSLKRVSDENIEEAIEYYNSLLNNT